MMLELIFDVCHFPAEHRTLGYFSEGGQRVSIVCTVFNVLVSAPTVPKY